MKWDTCHGWTDTWTNILTISTCVWNMSNHIVIVVIYGLTYLSFFKISFQWVSIVFDVSSTAYFCFQNYRITDVVFISDNVILFPFPMKKNMKVKVVEPFADRFRPFSSLAIRVYFFHNWPYYFSQETCRSSRNLQLDDTSHLSEG